MKLYELYSRDEAVEVLNELKSLFKNMGFTVSYDNHALDRLLGRDKEITKEQMVDTFKFLMMTQKKAFKPMRDKPIASMIVRDGHNLGNYVLNFSDNHVKIMTAIKKKGFRFDNDRQGSIAVDLKSHPSRTAPQAGIREEQPTEEAPAPTPSLEDSPRSKNTLTLKRK